MDKDNLYYIVKPGTNERIVVHGMPFIGTDIAATKQTSEWPTDHVIISIKEFEDTFCTDIK